MKQNSVPATSLAALPAGAAASVTGLAEWCGARKFAQFGFIRGARLRVVGFAPFGDLMRVRVMEGDLLLRSGDAAHISVRLLPGE